MFGIVKVLFVLSFAIFTCTNAGYIGGLEGGYEGHFGGNEILYSGGQESGHEEHHDYPKYQFDYSVHDPHTGDNKQHHEERDGDEVKGSYSLKEADGTTRIVEYKADKHSGFQAVVHKIGEPTHDQGHGAISHGYDGHY